MLVQMLQRDGTAAAWASANPILGASELGFETDTRRFKTGNGATAWNSLAYDDSLASYGETWTDLGNKTGALSLTAVSPAAYRITMTGNVTLNSASMPPVAAGRTANVFLEVRQDGTGGRTFTVNNTIKSLNGGIADGSIGLWQNLTASALTLYHFYYDGAAWWGRQFTMDSRQVGAVPASPALTLVNGTGTSEIAVASWTIPKGTLLATSQLQGKYFGQVSSTATLIFRVRIGPSATAIGSRALAAVFTTSAAGVANQHAYVDFLIGMLTAGVGGTASAGGMAYLNIAPLPQVAGAFAAAAVDTTVDNVIAISVQQSAGQTLTSRGAALNFLAA